MVDLEILFSARNHEDYEKTRDRRRVGYESVPITEAIFKRAIVVQGQLSRTGKHRVPIPDLIIAATAESAGLTVLHYDSDFDQIAQVTGQPVEWVVPRGSV